MGIESRKENTLRKPDIKLQKNFGELIQGLRHGKGWTQTVLAKKLGVNTTTVSKIENGEIEVGIKYIRPLLRIFKYDYLHVYKNGTIEARRDTF
jgi:transcriptional regulator with XRE-family HTH domain